MRSNNQRVPHSHGDDLAAAGKGVLLANAARIVI